MAAHSSEQRTGFLDLSAELRNRIYDLALHARKPGPLRLVSLVKDNRVQRGRSRSYRVFAVEAEQLSPNILAACKQIHAEATPVLYGSNIIAYTWSQRFWLQYIATSVRFLRHIETDVKGVGALPENPRLKSLQTLTVRYDYGRVLTHVSHVVHVLLSLSTTLRANRKQERLGVGLQDMFKFDVAYDAFYQRVSTSAVRDANSKVLEAGILQELEEMLGG